VLWWWAGGVCGDVKRVRAFFFSLEGVALPRGAEELSGGGVLVLGSSLRCQRRETGETAWPIRVELVARSWW
jgi:hypothetical protein